MIIYHVFILISFLQLICGQSGEMEDVENIDYWNSPRPGLPDAECNTNLYTACNRGTPGGAFPNPQIRENVRQYLNNSFTTLADIKPDKPLCPALRVRRNWKCLTDIERDRVIAVWQQMYEDGTMALFADQHDKYWPAWQKTGEFFPAHRRLLVEFEQAMMAIDPRVTLPYWEPWVYSPHPERSSVWPFLGTAGNYSDGFCVFDGNFTGYIPCLKRHWTCRQTIYPFASSEIITSIIQNSENYFLLLFKTLVVQNQYYANIGGYEGQYSMRDAPYDPIFWMNHAAISDLLLLKWQFVDEKNLVPLSYNMVGYKFNQTNGNIEPANIARDTLTGFPDPKPTVREQFWVGFGDLCSIPDYMFSVFNRLATNMTETARPTALVRLQSEPGLLVRYYPYFNDGKLGRLYHVFEGTGQCNVPQTEYSGRVFCYDIPKPTFLQESEPGRRILKAYAYDNGLDVGGLIELFQQYIYQMWLDLNSSNYCSPFVTP